MRTTSPSTASTGILTSPPGSESTSQTPNQITIGSKSNSGLSPTGHTVLLSVLIPVLVLLAAAFGFWYLRRKRKQRRDQRLRLSEEVITYYDKKDQDQDPYIQQQPSPALKVPETANNDRPESKAELDAIHTARARTARHPSENFGDPRVELDVVGTVRAVDEDTKRRTWERQELEGSGVLGGSDVKG